MGGHFFVIVMSGLKPEHPLALVNKTRINRSCVVKKKTASFPYRKLEPHISSAVLSNIFNCVVPIYPRFLQVKHQSAVTKFLKTSTLPQQCHLLHEEFAPIMISLVLEATMLQQSYSGGKGTFMRYFL
jgi:hypothetical protein